MYSLQSTDALLKRIDAASAARQWFYLEHCLLDVWPQSRELAVLPPDYQAARWVCTLGALEHLQIGIDIAGTVRNPTLLDTVHDLKDIIRFHLRALPPPVPCPVSP